MDTKLWLVKNLIHLGFLEMAKKTPAVPKEWNIPGINFYDNL